ncbi:hypothetical protein CGLO_11439 [Colletotrichum gloeosporioides Cg-14]|uniref:Uncharacterized protein n=1 Tax=Colletotrichum gloeosporioides (strain Cg-14) TaxID=1237896 RepID=T0K0R3_COLGC|nr:hypothetical protein CGLO_11439 [Colletotrichum gloeosporioides Cg-14]
MARNVFKAKVIGIDLAWKAEALGSRAADTFDEFIAAPDQAIDWNEFQRSISDACQRLRNAKEARRNADYLVVTSGCETAFEGLIDYVCDGGSVICVGVPKSRGNLTIPLALMVERSIRFQGLLMGGWDESYEVMEYIREGKLRPLVGRSLSGWTIQYGMNVLFDFAKAQHPLPLRINDYAERAEICARHHEKEVRSRMLMLDYGEAVSWFLPGPIMEWQYARKIFAINRLDDNGDDEVEVAAWEESLNEAEYIVEEKARWNPQASPGSFLTVGWQPRKNAWQFRLGSVFDPKKDREMVEYCYGLEALGYELMEVTAANSVYYSHFVGEGVLDFLLKKPRLE